MRFYVVMGGLCALSLIAGLSAKAGPSPDEDARSTGYLQTNLVSDGAIPAENTDPNLVNSWGIAFGAQGPVWVADNGTGVATLYDGDGNPQPLVVTIPPPLGGMGPSSPTGIVSNPTNAFAVGAGAATASRFIFATEDGTISGWSPAVDPTNAILKVDNSSKTGAIYKGLALAANGTGQFLYATDFHNARIDVFDGSFMPARLPGDFRDPRLPSGYAPFGIRNINGDLYVTYALQDRNAEDDVAGAGHGFVDVFDADGNFIRRLISRGRLNSPWGLALAPASFGQFGGRLLVGNFGNGRINAFDLATGRFVGALERPNHSPIIIDGLWALSFGNGDRNQRTSTLFFSAGPNDEANGLYGRIDAVPRREYDAAPEQDDD